MTVDIILLRKNGVTVQQQVYLHPDTASAGYEGLLRDIMGEDFEEFQFADFPEVNDYLNGLGVEIEWLSEVEVNNYKNE